MISKELEQELEDNGLRYIKLRNDALRVFKKRDFVADIENRSIFYNDIFLTTNQAELIIKLAKEWQSKC